MVSIKGDDRPLSIHSLCSQECKEKSSQLDCVFFLELVIYVATQGWYRSRSHDDTNSAVSGVCFFSYRYCNIGSILIFGK